MIKLSFREVRWLFQDKTGSLGRTKIQTWVSYICFYTISYITSKLRQSHSNKLIMTLQI